MVFALEASSLISDISSINIHYGVTELQITRMKVISIINNNKLIYIYTNMLQLFCYLGDMFDISKNGIHYTEPNGYNYYVSDKSRRNTPCQEMIDS